MVDVAPPDPPRCVVVFRFSALGDILLTTPAVDALKKAWPDTRIVLVTKAQFIPLMRGNPNLHAIIGVSRDQPFSELVAAIRSHEPDAILDLHGKIRSKILRGVLNA